MKPSFSKHSVQNLQPTFLLNLAMITQALAEEAEDSRSGVIKLEPIALNSSFWKRYDVKRKMDDRPSEEDTHNAWEREISFLQTVGAISNINIQKATFNNEDGQADERVKFYELTLNNDVFQQFYVAIIGKALPYVYAYLRQNESQVVPLQENEYNCSWRITVMGNPEVTIDKKTYQLPEMREGRAYNIISFCAAHYPDKPVKQKVLSDELKANSISASGITNLKEAMRKSLFGEKGVLGFFVTASSKTIIVKTKAVINDKQRQLIIDSSQK